MRATPRQGSGCGSTVCLVVRLAAQWSSSYRFPGAPPWRISEPEDGLGVSRGDRVGDRVLVAFVPAGAGFRAGQRNRPPRVFLHLHIVVGRGRGHQHAPQVEPARLGRFRQQHTRRCHRSVDDGNVGRRLRGALHHRRSRAGDAGVEVHETVVCRHVDRRARRLGFLEGAVAGDHAVRLDLNTLRHHRAIGPQRRAMTRFDGVRDRGQRGHESKHQEQLRELAHRSVLSPAVQSTRELK